MVGNYQGRIKVTNQANDEHESEKWRRRRRRRRRKKRMKRRKSAPWVGSLQKGNAHDRKKCMAALERMVKGERRGPNKYKGKCKRQCGKEMAATNHEWHKHECVLSVCPIGATLSIFKVWETWLHFFCIQSMKKEFFDSCNLAIQVYGYLPRWGWVSTPHWVLSGGYNTPYQVVWGKYSTPHQGMGVAREPPTRWVGLGTFPTPHPPPQPYP